MYRPAFGHEHWRPRSKVICQTARSLGYDELDAQLWASTVMAQLQIREEIGYLVGQIANGELGLISWPVEEPVKIESEPAG